MNNENNYIDKTLNEYSFPLTTETGDVICQICGKEFKTITPQHLKKNHNTTIALYKIRYPLAPIVSEQTKLRQSYSQKMKNKEVDENDEIDDIENLSDNINEKNIEEEIEKEKTKPDKSINLDDYDISEKFREKFLKENKQIIINNKPKNIPVTKIDNNRNSIELQLKSFFPDIKKDQFITKIITNRIIYDYISDYADKKLKVIVDFPDTFWHNKDRFYDPNKKIKLQRDGWKIIEILKNENMIEKIKTELKK